MNTKRYLKTLCVFMTAAICVCSAISFTGCESTQTQSSTGDEVQIGSAVPISTDDEVNAVGTLKNLGIDSEALGINPNINYDKNDKVGFQLEKPKEGDTVAVIKTSAGDITLRFFPEQAPKTVTNFINLAKDGKYNGTTFHRVIKDFIVQGGHIGTDESNPNGTSSYGSQFEDEFCDKLFNIRGAVSMANTSWDTNGSQFFINQTDKTAFEKAGGWSEYREWWKNVKTQLINYKDSNLLSAFIQENGDKCYNTDIVSDEIRKLYETNGGNPNLDGAYNAVDRGNTVFAQVIDGMSVVDKIAGSKVDENYKPDENIVIESIEIGTYSQKTTSAENS